MALLITKKDGNYSDTDICGGISNTPTLHTSNTTSINSTSYGTFYTPVFTAPTTTNQCLGVALYISAVGTAAGGGLAVQLQEYDGLAWNDVGTEATWTHTYSVSSSDEFYWAYLEGINYTYSTTTAGYYRFAVRGATNNTYSVGQDTSGGIAQIVVDDRDVAITSSDQLLNFHHLTIDADITLAGTNTANIPRQQNQGLLCSLQNSGTMEFLSTASRTVNMSGFYYDVNEGKTWIGSEASPLTSSYTITFNFTNTTDEYGGYYGYRRYTFRAWGTNANANAGIQESIIVSGIGTTANPLVITDTSVNWAVNDPIVIEAHNNGESALKYIKTINSPTSFILSDTVGGAESGLSGSDYSVSSGETCLAINCKKNIIFQGATNYFLCYFYNDKNSGNSVFQGVEVKDNHMNSKSDCAVYFLSTKDSIYINGLFINRSFEEGIYFNCTGCTFDNIVGYNLNSDNQTGSYGMSLNGSTACVFNDMRIVDANSYFMRIITTNKCVFNDLRCSDQSRNGYYGVGFQNAHGNRFVGGQISAVNGRIWYIQGDALDNVITGMDIVLSGIGNTSHLIRISATYLGELSFINCNILAALVVDASTIFYTLSLEDSALGTRVGFQYINGNEEVINYLPSGIIEKTGKDSTGSDLDDNTESPTNKNCIKFTPNAGMSLYWQFKVPQKALEDVYLYRQGLHPSAHALSFIKGKLFLFGETEPADTFQAFGAIPEWVSGSMKATSPLSQNVFADVQVQVYSEDGLSSVYFSDINAGTNMLTDLSTWDNAIPSPVMLEMADWSPKAVWDVLATLTYSDNSFGKLVQSQTFDNGVYLDVASSYSGTGNLNGGRHRPVNNLADALVIADANNASTIHLSGTLTLDRTVSGYEFISWHNGKIDLNGQLNIATRFRNLEIYGANAGLGLYYDCRIKNVTTFGGVCNECSFMPTTAITMNTTFELVCYDCHNQTNGDVSVIFDMSVAGSHLHMYKFSGPIQIINSTDVTTHAEIDFVSGTFDIATSCIAGSFTALGNVNIIHTQTGTEVVQRAGKLANQQETNNLILS